MTSARLVIALETAAARLELRARLEAFGHVVLGEATDADTAWQLARRLQPHIALLHTDLGDGQSFEAAEAIRSATDASVFFCSDTYDPNLLERARQVGCAGYLVQPFTDVALEIAVCMALDRHREQQSLRRELADLKEKLEARKLINRAKAILMERHGLTEPEAFRRLQLQSMTTSTPMKALAEAVILSSRVMEGEKRRRTSV